MNIEPLIVKSDIKNIYQIFTSTDFISKIFSLNKKEINKENEKIEITKIYSTDELDSAIDYNKYIDNPIIIEQIKKLKKFKTEIELKILQEIIEYNEESLIIKYICNIDKPGYIKSMLSNQTTIYYLKIYPMEDNNELLMLYTYRKFIPCELLDSYNDNFILNNKDVLNNDQEYNKIVINPGLLLTAYTILGEEMVKEIILPSIYSIFDEFIDKYLHKRIKKCLKKRDILIYSKKK